jgi:hypothetical protein
MMPKQKMNQKLSELASISKIEFGINLLPKKSAMYPRKENTIISIHLQEMKI